MRPWVRAYLRREVEGMGVTSGYGEVAAGEGLGGRRKGSAPVGEAWFEEDTTLNLTPAILRKVYGAGKG